MPGEVRDAETEEYQGIRTELERKLKAPPTLDTDLMEFLMIARLTIWWGWEDVRHPAVKDIYDMIETDRLERRSALSRYEKMQETRMTRAIKNEYDPCTTRTIK